MTKKKKRTKLGRPRKISPIAQKMRDIVRETDLNYEKICVAADLKYNNFSNIFTRRAISHTIIEKLLIAGLITEADRRSHYEWIIDNPEKKRSTMERVLI